MTDFELKDLSAYVSPPEELIDPQMILLYGPYGQGKTWLAGSASQMEELAPVLYVDVEGSTTGTLSDFDSDKIDVVRVQKRAAELELHPYAFTANLLLDVLNNNTKYKTIVIDTVDYLQGFAEDYYESINPNPSDGYYVWRMIKKDFAMPGGIIPRLKEAPQLAILVVHERKDTNKDGVVLKTDFSLSGQSKELIGGFPDIVGYVTRTQDIKTGTVKGNLSMLPSKRNMGKNRFKLSDITDPTIEKLYNEIRRGK